MKRNRLQTGLLTGLIGCLALSGLALAGKPAKPGDGGGGGGGDPGPVPPGTIYFEQWEPDSGSAFASMQADGSGKTPGAAGEPSHYLHDGERWFLVILPTEFVDAFGNVHEEVYAVTEQGQMRQLTGDANLLLQAYIGWPVRWSADDSFLSFMALNAAPDPDAWQEALFVAEVDWSTGSPVINAPQRLLDSGFGDGLPLIGGYDWSPAGDEVVYDDQQNFDAISMKVTRFLAEGSTETRELGIGMFLPTWSPDGSRIAFGSLIDGAIWTIRPDGTDAVKLSNPSSSQQHTDQVWSPDGQHLAFTERTRKQTKNRGVYSSTYTYDILRISATGGAATNLTGDTDAECYSWAWR